MTRCSRSAVMGSGVVVMVDVEDGRGVNVPLGVGENLLRVTVLEGVMVGPGFVEGSVDLGVLLGLMMISSLG